MKTLTCGISVSFSLTAQTGEQNLTASTRLYPKYAAGKEAAGVLVMSQCQCAVTESLQSQKTPTTAG